MTARALAAAKPLRRVSLTAFAGALCIGASVLMSGCSSIGAASGAAAGVASGLVTSNPAVGIGVGIAVQAATAEAVVCEAEQPPQRGRWPRRHHPDDGYHGFDVGGGD